MLILLASNFLLSDAGTVGGCTAELAGLPEAGGPRAGPGWPQGHPGNVLGDRGPGHASQGGQSPEQVSSPHPPLCLRHAQVFEQGEPHEGLPLRRWVVGLMLHGIREKERERESVCVWERERERRRKRRRRRREVVRQLESPLLFKSCDLRTPSCNTGFTHHSEWHIKMVLIAAHHNAEIFLMATV